MKTNWEEEFDSKWSVDSDWVNEEASADSQNYVIFNEKKVKKFIRSLLTQSQKDYKEELIKKVEGIYESKKQLAMAINEREFGKPSSYSMNGYMAALSDVLQTIKEL